MVGFAYALKNVAWVYWTAMLIAAAHLVSAGAYANSGMLSPSGVGVYVAPVLYYLWIGAISVWIRR